MADQFGGIPVEETDSFGGIPIDELEAVEVQEPTTQDSPLDSALDVAGEFAAGAVRTTSEGVDTLSAAIDRLSGQAPGRAIAVLLQGGGIDDAVTAFNTPAVPSLRESLAGTGVEGGFMEPGLARDVVSAAGETVPAALGAGQVARMAAQRLPQVTAGESTATGLLREAGRSTAPQDVAAGVLSAAGGEVGEELGGQTGRLVGATVAPLAGGVAFTAAPIAREGRQVTRAVREAAPAREDLRQAARSLYRQVDDLGVTIDSEPLTNLSKGAADSVRKAGFNARIHPRVAAALDEMDTLTSQPMTISEIDTMRRVARAAAQSTEPDEQRLGGMLVEMIDNLVADLPRGSVRGARQEQVAPLLREARGLWRRVRNSETIDEAIERARNQASGFENGMRIQFRQILNSPKRRRSFNQEELSAMRDVVRGGTAENIFRALGKLGFTDQQNAAIFMPSLGIAGGAAAAGAPGAVAVPLVGSLARRRAEAMTRENVALADDLVRAGSDAARIARAYLRSTPKDQRNSGDLATLLLTRGADFNTAKALDNRLVTDAAFLASVLSNLDETESENQTAPELPE